MLNLKLKNGALALLGAFLCGLNADAVVVTYEFENGTGLDNAGINATMTTNGVTITTVEIVGWDGSLASTGVVHRTNIISAGNLGVNSKTTPPNAGNDARDFDPGEAWVFFFDADVYLSEIDLASLDINSVMTISSPAFSTMVLNDDGGSADVYSLSNTFVSAGTLITFANTSAESTEVESHDFRISSLTVDAVTNAVILTETASGTPYAWLDLYFQGLETTEDYLLAESSDTDGDKLTAGEEYLAGTVPTNATSVLIVDSVGTSDTNQVVSWQSVTGKCYSIVVSTNLSDLSKDWKTVKNNIQGLETQTSVTAAVTGATSAFVKVGVEKREIYLLIGQSNMAGRGPMEAGDMGEIEGCELFNFSEEWEPATNPLNQYSTIRKDLEMQQLNPGYGFALRMHEVRPDINIGLVVNARGGTNINDWEKGDHYYEEAVSRALAAVEDGGRLAGILWHQGESNSSQTNTYMGTLTTMITDLRTELGDPDLPFVAGQLEQDDVTPEVKERPINDYIILLPTLLPNTAVATTEGLTTQDGTHFDSASQRELGRRYADALMSIE
ncbi:sialate O-acetylesterase [Pontiellaceae bacterium B1224]|nr:sialate O-acetylesterase [Pontiellaceae bacterium B1224]